MVDKEQQILEMADFLFDNAENYCEADGHIITNKLAEVLYEEGYRKIGEKDLLITEEELKNKCYIMKGTCKGELNILDIVRKQTAKEIMQAIYDICKERKEIQFDDLYFLIKRYGVEAVK